MCVCVSATSCGHEFAIETNMHAGKKAGEALDTLLCQRSKLNPHPTKSKPPPPPPPQPHPPKVPAGVCPAPAAATAGAGPANLHYGGGNSLGLHNHANNKHASNASR